MPSLPNPETTMTLAGVGMVRDSSFSSSFFSFLSLSLLTRFDQSYLKKAIRDESSLKQFVFLDPYMPPNLGGGGRAPTTTKKKKKERAHTKRDRARSIAFFFVTREVLLDRFLEREDAARALVAFRSIFVFYSFLQLSLDQARRDKKKGEKRNFYLTFVLLSLSFDLYLTTTTTTTTTVQLRRANAPRPGMGERFLLQERRG